jgi:hypothetical protein
VLVVLALASPRRDVTLLDGALRKAIPAHEEAVAETLDSRVPAAVLAMGPVMVPLMLDGLSARLPKPELLDERPLTPTTIVIDRPPHVEGVEAPAVG